MRTVAIAVALAVVLATPASARWVYFSHFPRACLVDYVYDLETTGIYVKTPPNVLTTGTSFRLDLNGLGPEDIVSVTAADGVTILGGNLFDGVTLTWAQRVLDHAPVLWIEISNNPPTNDIDPPWDLPNVTTRDVTLFTLDGNESLDDVVTGINLLIHCWDPFAWFSGPDTVDVVVGRTTDFQVTGSISAISGGASVYADDDAGWLPNGSLVGIGAACPVCPWDEALITISVTVPGGVEDGTLSHGRVWANWNGDIGGHDVVLRAVQPIATETTSFGRLKALYRDKNQ